MKKVRCPRCDEPLFFDEGRYAEGHALHLHCVGCGRNFTLRRSEPEFSPDAAPGSVVVLENDWCYRQEFPLSFGTNIVGRRSVGTTVQIPIDSGDDSLARNHCVITVSPDRSGETCCTLQDFPSRSGTFLNGRRLSRNERIRLADGDTVVLGATTLLIRLSAKP